MTSTDRLPALPWLCHRDQARTLADDAPAGEGTYLLVGDGMEHRLLPIDRATVHVGRSPAADVVLEHPFVSRRQATIVRTRHGLTLHDDQSTNGTTLNGRRITTAALHDGDVIAFGPVVAVFRDTHPAGCVA